MSSLLQELLSERTNAKERHIRFHPSSLDRSTFVVYCKEKDDDEEIIGYVYLDIESNEYTAVTETGDELCRPTPDFNTVAKQFEIHARLRALLKLNSEISTDKWPQYNLTTNNLHQMKNQNPAPAKGKKENQLIFVEYTRPTKEGHMITATDSYKNTLGKIHRSYNPQTGNYEYRAYDFAGKPLGEATTKIWELKKFFSSNSKQLLEEAHQRRIDAKAQNREMITDKEQPTKESKIKSRSADRNNGQEKYRQEQPPENFSRQAGSDQEPVTSPDESERVDLSDELPDLSHYTEDNDPDYLEPELTDEELREIRQIELDQMRERDDDRGDHDLAR